MLICFDDVKYTTISIIEDLISIIYDQSMSISLVRNSFKKNLNNNLNFISIRIEKYIDIFNK